MRTYIWKTTHFKLAGDIAGTRGPPVHEMHKYVRERGWNFWTDNEGIIWYFIRFDFPDTCDPVEEASIRHWVEVFEQRNSYQKGYRFEGTWSGL